MTKNNILLISLILTIGIIVIGWDVHYDSVCFFDTNCNRGINPISYVGLPFPHKSVGLFTGEQTTWFFAGPILSFIILFTVFYAVFSKISAQKTIYKKTKKA